MESSDTPSCHTEDHGPYQIDRVLDLTVNSCGEVPPLRRDLCAQVKQQTRAWTLSCGMKVEILDHGQYSGDGASPTKELGKNTSAFLKLFDRRYAHQLRDDNGIDPWSENFEQELIKNAQSGKIDKFLYQLRHDKQFRDDTEDDWDAAENEAFLWSELSRLFDAETTTYSVLQRYQGDVIPRFLGEVTHHPRSPDVEVGMQQKLCQVKGILLEYLPGFSMATVMQHAPRSWWQDIVNQAIKIVHVLNDNEILNTDVRPDNFMVVPKPDTEGTYHVFMVDFGQCRLRREDESDAEWGRAKWIQDEEGAVGMVMRHILGKEDGFQLEYTPSLRYLTWAPGEDD